MVAEFYFVDLALVHLTVTLKSILLNYKLESFSTIKAFVHVVCVQMHLCVQVYVKHTRYGLWADCWCWHRSGEW